MKRNQEEKQSIIKFYRQGNKNIDPRDVGIVIGSAGVIEYFVDKMEFGRMYIADPIKAAAVNELTGTKTVHQFHLNALRVLGFSVIEVEKNSIKKGLL